MKIEIKIDAACTEPQVIIVTDQMTDEVNQLVQRISDETPKVLVGFLGDTLKILEERQIIRIYALAGKVIAVTEEGEYTLRQRLYELENRLDKSRFVRISNSEIVNLKKVNSFDLRLTGTICVSLTDGTVSYVSRRYVAKIKQVLGI